MIKRILSGIIGGGIYIGLGLLGGPWLALGLGLLLLLGTYEFWRLARRNAIMMHLEIPAIVGLSLVVAVTAAVGRADSWAQIHAAERLFSAALIILLAGTALVEVLSGRTGGAAAATSVTLFGGVYISFPLAYMILLRAMPGSDGLFYFFLLTVVTWANDSAAYFVGSAIGRHHFAPSISPKKTVEGSVAGLIASALASLVYAAAMARSPWPAMGAGLLVGLFGQAGDLFESLLKRDFAVKDSGAFLPGHGGMLDRFDSLILAAPALYYLVSYLGH